MKYNPWLQTELKIKINVRHLLSVLPLYPPCITVAVPKTFAVFLVFISALLRHKSTLYYSSSSQNTRCFFVFISALLRHNWHIKLTCSSFFHPFVCSVPSILPDPFRCCSRSIGWAKWVAAVLTAMYSWVRGYLRLSRDSEAVLAKVVRRCVGRMKRQHLIGSKV